MIQIKSHAKIITREIGSNVKFVGCKTRIVQQSDSCNGKFNFKAWKLCQLRKGVRLNYTMRWGKIKL